jgi:hypothetical protein
VTPPAEKDQREIAEEYEEEEFFERELRSEDDTGGPAGVDVTEHAEADPHRIPDEEEHQPDEEHDR